MRTGLWGREGVRPQRDLLRRLMLLQVKITAEARKHGQS